MGVRIEGAPKDGIHLKGRSLSVAAPRGILSCISENREYSYPTKENQNPRLDLFIQTLLPVPISDIYAFYN